jgi:glycosyltransferase involved in cell wall biosynthesis
MRVAHVLDAMGGGTKKHIELLIAGQMARGVDVTLALPLSREFSARSALMDYAFPAAMRARGVRVEQFPFVHGRIAPREDLACVVALVRFFRRERLDVVHTHSAKAGMLGRVAAAVARTSAIVHTPYSLPFRQEEAQGARYWLYYALERMAGAVTDVMIATSRGEQAEILRAALVPPERVRLVPNCFDLHRYEYAFDGRAAAKTKLGFDTDRFVIGTVARLSPQKDIGTLVSAAAAIRDRGVNIQVVIVGDGEQKAAIEQQIRALGLTNQFLLTGARSDYRDFVNAFDVFAFPSLWEGLPYAPLEAMAVGTPIVATAAVGTTDLVEDGVTGLLVPLRDAGAFAAAVMRLLAQPALARSLAERGRRFVESRFGAEEPVTSTLKAYEDAIARRAGTAGSRM